jgi:hypothetical protein
MTLPAGVEEAVVVGPGDLLVVRVHRNVGPETLDRVASDIGKGPLAGRVLVVAAEQIGVVRR